jgi:mono/diheme cytochrome c family protein
LIEALGLQAGQRSDAVKYLVGFIVGLLLVPTIAFLYLWFGYAPVATASPPLPLEATITRIALNKRIAEEAPKAAPIEPSPANLIAGATIYTGHCVVCHSGISGTASAIAKGMFPRPPELLHGKGVTDDRVGETYWKAANGIRLSGMPAFRGSLTDTQLWQVSEVLAHANNLPAAVRARLAEQHAN